MKKNWLFESLFYFSIFFVFCNLTILNSYNIGEEKTYILIFLLVELIFVFLVVSVTLFKVFVKHENYPLIREIHVFFGLLSLLVISTSLMFTLDVNTFGISLFMKSISIFFCMLICINKSLINRYINNEKVIYEENIVKDETNSQEKIIMLYPLLGLVAAFILAVTVGLITFNNFVFSFLFISVIVFTTCYVGINTLLVIHVDKSKRPRLQVIVIFMIFQIIQLLLIIAFTQGMSDL